jgi:lysophospholipase L1-like esterase
LLAVSLAACAKDPDAGKGGSGGAAGGSAGAGGAGGDMGAGGSADGGAGGTTVDGGGGDAIMMPACDPTASTMGAITVPSPIVSIGKPIMASAGVTNPAVSVDGKYHNAGTATLFPAAQYPGWVAIQLGAGPTRLLLLWSDPGYNDYNNVGGGAPNAYHIETSADSTNGSDGTWTMVADVMGNPVRNRAHTFDFTGMSWVRFTITLGPQPSTPVTPPAVTSSNIDEIEIHDISASGTANPPDTWFFMGDSITKGAFQRSLASPFDADVHTAHPAYAPTVLAGGIGGELSTMGVAHIDQWLALNPDIQHWAILYGTNDSWDNAGDAAPGMGTNLQTIVSKILAAGRVPILGRIPYASQHHATLPVFNAVVDQVATSNKLPCGPDFYGYFAEHPDQLGPDGVHPGDPGYVAMNKLWADMAGRLYPSN